MERWHSLTVPPAARRAAAIAIGLGLLINVVRWGGTARGGPLFVLGVAALIGLGAALGGALWWLYRSPLRDGPVAAAPLPTAWRQAFASSALVGGMLFLVGGFWDEVWHRRYGGFGDDFLWAPHMMIYASIAIFLLLAGGGVALTLRRAGGLRARFRAEPLPGLMALVAGYLLLSLPADELWHRIYGKDLTAWSLPHLTIVAGVGLIMLAGLALQLGAAPPAGAGWRPLWRAEWQRWLALLLVAWAASALLQVGVTEWDSLRLNDPRDAFAAAFWRRPQWLYPVVVLSISVFCGALALRATRLVGAATAAAAAVFGFRWLLIAIMGGNGQSAPGDGELRLASHGLALIPALGLDLAAALLRERWRGWRLAASYAATGAAFLAISAPLINRLMVYPHISSLIWAPLAAAGIAMALLAGWAGAALGEGLRALAAPADQPAAAAAAIGGADRRLAWGTLGGMAALLAGLVILIARTPPPL